jgi:hypothetical protein
MVRVALPCWLAACLLGLTACGSGDPQPKLLVITPAPAATTRAVTLAPNVRCRPAPDTVSAGSHFVFAGPCAFTVASAVRCVHRADDFYAYITRRLPHGFGLSVIINVEKYHGPGTYRDVTEVYMQVIKGLDLFAWGQRTATATVAEDERHLTLEPLEARAWAGTLAKGTETLGGSLVCRDGGG